MDAELKEHRNMVAALSGKPELKDKILLNKQQIATWNAHQNKWYRTFQRIDYIYMVELHTQKFLFLPPIDPFDEVEWNHPLQKEMSIVHGNFYYSILQILKASFDTIKAKALSEKLDFQFDDARSLFVKICVEDADYGVSEVFGTEEGETLTKLRNTLTKDNIFFGGKKKLSSAEKKQQLDSLKNSGWSGYWLYATYDHWRTPDMESHWEQFRKSHQAICKVFDKKFLASQDVRIFLPQWIRSYPYEPKNGYPIDLIPQTEL